MAVVRDVQKNYHLPDKSKTIGEQLAEARQKSGAEKLASHDIMGLNRFTLNNRPIVIFPVASFNLHVVLGRRLNVTYCMLTYCIR